MYQLTEIGTVKRLADGVFIPNDPANTDCRDYLAWVAQGNSPAPYVPPEPTVPQVVTRFQARAALARDGLFLTVNAAMKALPEDDEHRLAWEDAQEFRRQSPTLLAMAATLGLTDTQLDELFTVAAGIEA